MNIYNIAYIVKMIHEKKGSPPGKKVLQKYVYLIENSGIGFNMDYELYYYGPYSRKLDHAVYFLNAENIIIIDKDDGHTHKIIIDDESFIEDVDLSDDQKNIIENVISKYDSDASNLELLATTHYAYKHITDVSINNIINAVKLIKGEKYTESQIKRAIEMLELQLP